MAARSRSTVAVALVIVVVGAVVAAFVLGVGPRIGGDADTPTSTTTTAVPPPSGPGLDLQTPRPAAAVLPASAGGAPISVSRLRQHLAAALALPGLGSLDLAVTQLGRPGVLLHTGGAAATPASTLKLLTTEAALAALGPDHRFTTTVVRGPTPASVILVGGGDPLLVDAAPADDTAATPYPEPASLQALATATAARLTADGVRRVRLGFDDSLFSGPAVNPHWPATYIPEYVVSPISALWVDEGRTTPGLAERSTDPALAAARAFGDRLRRAGITVTNEPARQRVTGKHPAVVASVSSAPLDQIVEHVLETSDNEGAEVLLRHVALASGRPGSSAAGVTAVRSELEGLGLDVAGAVVHDGSGLSREDTVPVRLLLDVLRTAVAPARGDLRAVVSGLPVAGFNGSLGYRFDSQGDGAAGLGYVRAKTGTLTGVHGLAGLAVTRSRQVLLFVAVADKVPVPLTLQARDGLDQLTAALATCGC